MSDTCILWGVWSRVLQLWLLFVRLTMNEELCRCLLCFEVYLSRALVQNLYVECKPGLGMLFFWKY